MDLQWESYQDQAKNKCWRARSSRGRDWVWDLKPVVRMDEVRYDLGGTSNGLLEGNYHFVIEHGISADDGEDKARVAKEWCQAREHESATAAMDDTAILDAIDRHSIRVVMRSVGLEGWSSCGASGQGHDIRSVVREIAGTIARRKAVDGTRHPCPN
jgi:hypothetical protein